jgi:MinD-like ATPase involved in chromosome partitioning or flagellar assembly
MQARAAASIRVAVVGGSSNLARLCAALEDARELELVPCGYAERLDSAVDAVVLELRRDALLEEELATLREVTAAPVVCLVPEPSSALVERALDSGIADVLVRPYDAGGVLFAIEKAVRAVRRDAVQRTGQVITVFSPKGGTGKSVLSANLASGLARRGGRRTLLVDLDLQFGDAAIMLGLSPKSTVRELLASPGTLDAEQFDVYAEHHSAGLDVLAAPLHPEDAELIGDDEVRSVLNAARSAYDIVVVDTSPFFHGSTLASVDLTDDLVLVCTPDIPTAKNVRLALETLELLSFPAVRTRVVLNRAGEQGGLRTEEVEQALAREVEFVLPFDPAVPRGVNRGNPAVLDSARGEFATALTAMARELLREAQPAPATERPRHRLLALARR